MKFFECCFWDLTLRESEWMNFWLLKLRKLQKLLKSLFLPVGSHGRYPLVDSFRLNLHLNFLHFVLDIVKFVPPSCKSRQIQFSDLLIAALVKKPTIKVHAFPACP